jgi:hypothetical protein
VSRRGPDAPGAAELAVEITELGATVSVATCDVTDRPAVQKLLVRVHPCHPLTAVFHTAGVLDDGIIESLTSHGSARCFAPRRMRRPSCTSSRRTRSCRPSFCSTSFAGTLGNAGQANYAAANAYLDAVPSSAGPMDLLRRQSSGAAWAGSGMADEPVTELLRRGVTRHGTRARDHDAGGRCSLERAPGESICPLTLSSGSDTGWRTAAGAAGRQEASAS